MSLSSSRTGEVHPWFAFDVIVQRGYHPIPTVYWIDTFLWLRPRWGLKNVKSWKGLSGEQNLNQWSEREILSLGRRCDLDTVTPASVAVLGLTSVERLFGKGSLWWWPSLRCLVWVFFFFFLIKKRDKIQRQEEKCSRLDGLLHK